MTKSRARNVVRQAAIAGMLIAAALSFSDAADAATVCRARMAGEGTGTGLFGQSTTAARANALANWVSRVGARHGQAYTSAAKARGMRYDCREGAIFQSKCAVSASPCAEVRARRPERRTARRTARRR